MKHVVKGASPTLFEDWKSQTTPDAGWQPRYADLRHPHKRALHEALLIEQGGVCCYCGRTISLGDSHIEHFRPQDLRGDLALDFGNLHASCIRETRPGQPLHCGHAKGNGFDEERHISPQDPVCEQRFLYAADGAIHPTDPSDTQACYMRDLLCLDIAFLRNRRRGVLERVFDHGFLSTATDTELTALIEVFRRPPPGEAHADFGHVLARYAERLLPPPP
jgi:uncharacterized protein (TIGR02646 family)